MKLSIIMPVYNVEKYIKRCMNSIINQFESNFELIVVDDGSKDNSIKIVEAMIKKLKNVRIISKENGGLSDARNFGMQYAKGEYITFLDSDDNIEPDYVEKIVNAINKYKSDLLLFGYYVDTFSNDKIVNTKTYIEKYQKVDIKNNDCVIINNDNCIGYAWNKVYKKDIINYYNLKYEKSTSYIEDILFNEKYINKCEKIIVLNEALYHYNQYDSITLGKKIYKDMLSLDVRASKCFYNILKSFNYSESIAKDKSNYNLISRFSWGIQRVLFSDKKLRKELVINYSNYLKTHSELYNYMSKKNKIFYKIFENKLYFINKFLLKLSEKYKKIKGFIPLKIKWYFKYLLSPSNFYEKEKELSKVFIILSSNYGNLGDCLITKAQEKFLSDLYPNKIIIRINANEVFTKIKSLKKSLKNDDIITFIGGGNFGDLYYELEFARKFSSKYLKDYKKIYFPQTITCKDKEISFLKKNKKIYNSNKNMIMLRDKESFDVLNGIYNKSKNICSPDIVLYLKKYIRVKQNKNICLLCLRNDKEKNIKVDNRSINNYFYTEKVYHTDTQIHNNNMTDEIVDYELDKIISLFSKSKIVITDRLHGMIISYVTKTPFIAFDNNNKKLSRVYNMWLKESNGVVLSSSKEFSKDLLKTIENSKYKKINYEEDFTKIKQEIYNFIGYNN